MLKILISMECVMDMEPMDIRSQSLSNYICQVLILNYKLENLQLLEILNSQKKHQPVKIGNPLKPNFQPPRIGGLVNGGKHVRNSIITQAFQKTSKQLESKGTFYIII